MKKGQKKDAHEYHSKEKKNKKKQTNRIDFKIKMET